MGRYVLCHLCGCTGMQMDARSGRMLPCANGCVGGRVYEAVNAAWFEALARNGATIHEDPQRAKGLPIVRTPMGFTGQATGLTDA